NVLWPFRCNHTVFRKVTAQCIDRLSSLSHQQVTCFESHRLALLFRAFDCDKAHGRAGRCLGDRLRVSSIILLPLHKGLHILRSDQTYFKAKFADLSSPIMSTGASFHSHDTWWMGGEE